MKLHSKHGHAALMVAVAGAAALGAVKSTFATTFTTTSQTDTLIESANFAGTTRLTAEGETSGAAASFWDYSLLQFNTSALLPTQTQATSFNSITLNLVDKAESFAVAGLVDVYLTTFTGSPTTLTYQTDAASQPNGIGNGTNPGSMPGTLYSLGQINYLKTSNTTYSPSGTSLTLSAAAQSYILNQINAGGTIGFVLADHTSGVAADFEGSNGTTTLAKPSLVLDVGTSAITSSNSTFTVNGGAKTQTIDLGRIAAAVSSSTTVTLTNSGTNNGTYSVIPGAAGATGSLVAAGTGSIGVEPVASGGGTSTVTVGINPTTLTPGQPTAAAPATATVVIHDQTNAADPDITVTVQADQVVASRIIDNAGGTTNVVTYGKVLAGTSSAPASVTLDTENTNSLDYTSNSLTSVTLLANTTLSNSTLLGVSNTTLDKDAASLAAGSSDVLFNDGSVTTTRNVTFNAPASTVGGLYQTDSYYDGYLVVPLQNSDTALNAVTNPTARVYMEADVYQPASVSGSASGYTFSLINAPHTVNKVNSTLGDIGARASAQVTSVALAAQAGWSTSLATGTVLADSATSGGTSGGTAVTAATFDPTNKWNGTYGGTLSVGLQNDQSINGATPNDLGTSNYTLNTVVTGNTAANTSNASVNVLPGGSFSGYSISSGSTRNSTLLLVGGTSTSGNTITLTSFAAPSSAQAASEKATITETGSDTFVVEMYDPAITSASDVLAYTNGSGANVAAVLGNTGGTASEVIGAYNGSTAIGTYGVDVVGHTVWAVVNHVGSFEAFSQKLGDANGDGKVDLSDLNIVLNDLGTTTSVWAKGNFDGAATIDLTDLNDVLNNLGTGNPVGATAAPEPASLGLAGLGVAGLLLRRRRAAR